MKPLLRIGMVVGEASGDILGAGLMQALKAQHSNIEFEGIGGPLMIAEGFRTMAPMERLAVMGFIEPAGRLFELMGIRRRLYRHFRAQPPDVFIGIDAPAFTLGLEARLKKLRIKTVHYVSPQVWAWRQGRVKKIAKSVDRMLVLFPFEQDFYRRHGVDVTFVGHPLADAVALETPQLPARAALDIAADEHVLALLPGSRLSEIKRIADTFIATALECSRRWSRCRVVIAASNARVAEEINQILSGYPELDSNGVAVDVVVANSRQVMAAADLLLLASGTVTLEAALVKRPMVVAYKMAPMTYRLAQRLVKAKFIALPNLLADKMLVPEFIQEQASPAQLAQALTNYVNDPQLASQQQQAFLQIHQQLRQGASDKAAHAVMELIQQ